MTVGKVPVIVGQLLGDIILHGVAQGIGVPATAPDDRLLSPRPTVAHSLRSHPAGLAPFLAEQPVPNKPAEAATRSWLNNGRIRLFAARNDDAQSSSVSSIDATIAMTSSSWLLFDSERHR